MTNVTDWPDAPIFQYLGSEEGEEKFTQTGTTSFGLDVTVKPDCTVVVKFRKHKGLRYWVSNCEDELWQEVALFHTTQHETCPDVPIVIKPPDIVVDPELPDPERPVEPGNPVSPSAPDGPSPFPGDAPLAGSDHIGAMSTAPVRVVVSNDPFVFDPADYATGGGVLIWMTPATYAALKASGDIVESPGTLKEHRGGVSSVYLRWPDAHQLANVIDAGVVMSGSDRIQYVSTPQPTVDPDIVSGGHDFRDDYSSAGSGTSPVSDAPLISLPGKKPGGSIIL